MNRQIEFRGKRLDNGEWGYGYYVYDYRKEIHYIFTNIVGITNAGFKPKQCDYQLDCFEVDPSTVGQFTGLVDKNGKRIYEGDLIQSNQSKYKRFNENGIYEIYFNEFLCHFALVDSSVEWNNKNEAYDNYSLTGAKTKDFKVIDNIFDKECESENGKLF